MFNARLKEAIKLGYDSVLDYVIVGSSFASAKDLETAIDKLEEATARDNDELMIMLRKEFPDREVEQPWNTPYYVRKYTTMCDNGKFPVAETIARVMSYFAKHYDYKITKNKNEKCYWHCDVMLYDVFSGDDLIGKVYLDMFPRDGKYTHAMTYPLATRTVHYPGIASEAVVVMNVEKSGFNYRTLRTFVHELGHVFHHIIMSESGNNYYSSSGFNSILLDKIEVPSRYIEKFIENDVFYKYITGKTYPQKCRDLARYLYAYSTMYQIAMAKADLEVHASKTKLTYSEVNAIFHKWIYPKNSDYETNFPTNFIHFKDYYGRYYSYLMGDFVPQPLAGGSAPCTPGV
jgi:thimet oligopeptidase